MTAVGRRWGFIRALRMAVLHPQQTSEQLPPRLSECLHASYGEEAWNDRNGRRADIRNFEFGGRESPGADFAQLI